MKYLIAYIVLCLLVAIYQGYRIGWIGTELRSKGQNANPDWSNLFFQALNPLGFIAACFAGWVYVQRNPAPIKATAINLGGNN